MGKNKCSDIYARYLKTFAVEAIRNRQDFTINDFYGMFNALERYRFITKKDFHRVMSSFTKEAFNELYERGNAKLVRDINRSRRVYLEQKECVQIVRKVAGDVPIFRGNKRGFINVALSVLDAYVIAYNPFPYRGKAETTEVESNYYANALLNLGRLALQTGESWLSYVNPVTAQILRNKGSVKTTTEQCGTKMFKFLAGYLSMGGKLKRFIDYCCKINDHTSLVKWAAFMHFTNQVDEDYLRKILTVFKPKAIEILTVVPSKVLVKNSYYEFLGACVYTALVANDEGLLKVALNSYREVKNLLQMKSPCQLLTERALAVCMSSPLGSAVLEQEFVACL